MSSIPYRTILLGTILAWGSYYLLNQTGYHGYSLTGNTHKRVLVGFAVDCDAVSGWINTAGTGTTVSMADLSRGIWGGTVAVERVLKMLSKYNIKATFFIPGHTLESFPHSMKKIKDAGHEIGLHGYAHESVADLSEVDERAVMRRSMELLTEYVGQPPRGWTAPSWLQSNNSVKILEEFGLLYDHSFQHHDCQPYYLPYPPLYTETDLSLRPEDWMHPMSEVKLSSIVEIPGSWHLDDFPPFAPGPTADFQGFVDPDVVLKIWKSHFDYFYGEYDTFIFPLSIHPDFSGRAHVMLMQEKLIAYINKHVGVEWMTMEQMAQEFKSGNFEGHSVLAGAVR